MPNRLALHLVTISINLRIVSASRLGGLTDVTGIQNRRLNYKFVVFPTHPARDFRPVTYPTWFCVKNRPLPIEFRHELINEGHRKLSNESILPFYWITATPHNTTKYERNKLKSTNHNRLDPETNTMRLRRISDQIIEKLYDKFQFLKNVHKNSRECFKGEKKNGYTTIQLLNTL